MAHNYFSEIHLHIVWHTKSSRPLLTSNVEPVVHRYLRQRIINTPGAFVHEIGGTESHAHLAVTLSPNVLLSEFIGQLKGASAHEINQQMGRGGKIPEWQSGYGVVSFGTKDLPWVQAYIRNQRQHHAQGTVEIRLERSAPEEAAEATTPRTPVNGGPHDAPDSG